LLQGAAETELIFGTWQRARFFQTKSFEKAAEIFFKILC